MNYFFYPHPQPQQRRPNAPSLLDGPPIRGPILAAVLTAVLAWPADGEPVPHESLRTSPPAATLPAQVFPDPPNRGPIEAQDLHAVLSWPQSGEPVPHESLLRRPYFQHLITAGDTDLPGVRRTHFTFYVTEGTFYQQWYAIPTRLPSGLQATDADNPPPRAAYQTSVQDQAWVITWEAQQRPQFEPESQVTAQADIPRGRHQPLAIVDAWSTPVFVELPLASAPQLADSDQPPRRLRQPEWVLESWQVSWQAQAAQTVEVADISDEPAPFRRQPHWLRTAWEITWDAQRAATSAEWIPPPAVAGDEISRGRILPQNVLDAWQPPFRMPERAPTFDQASTGDAPNPLRPFPRHVLDQWQVSWPAQQGPAFTEGGTFVPPVHHPRFISDEDGRFGFVSDETGNFGFVSDETIPL